MAAQVIVAVQVRVAAQVTGRVKAQVGVAAQVAAQVGAAAQAIGSWVAAQAGVWWRRLLGRGSAPACLVRWLLYRALLY